MANQPIKININKPQIDFDMAGIIVKGNYDMESLIETVSLKDDADFKAKIETNQEKLKSIDADNYSSDDLKNAIDSTISIYEDLYSSVFENGAIRAVYAEIGDIMTTLDAFQQAFDYMLDKLTEESKEKRKAQANKYME